jgi:type II secretory pathway component PulC
MKNILTLVQIVLVVLLTASLVYTGAYVFRPSGGVSIDVTDVNDEPEGEIVLNAIMPVAEPYDVYMDKIVSRDIFSSVAPSVSAFVPSAGESELPVNLKIVGIVVGTPSEIIVEDSSAHQTYFILEGQSQAGITLQRISDGQVLLSFQGKNIVVQLKGSRDSS